MRQALVGTAQPMRLSIEDGVKAIIIGVAGAGQGFPLYDFNPFPFQLVTGRDLDKDSFWNGAITWTQKSHLVRFPTTNR